VTGGICVSAAALIPGTVVNEIVSEQAKRTGTVRVGHPSGVFDFVISLEKSAQGEWKLTKAGLGRTARRIMDGYVYVSRKAFAEEPQAATASSASSR
jgi:2-methylaconitate cis-trans-isomerase PrpF